MGRCSYWESTAPRIVHGEATIQDPNFGMLDRYSCRDIPHPSFAQIDATIMDTVFVRMNGVHGWQDPPL